jgi:CheY-like chemotaxis protein
MSHEIRTPMNGVLGFAQLGHRLADAPTEARRLFGRIVDAGRLLQAILNDVLDMSKIEAGKLQLSPEPTAVRNVTRRSIDLVGDAARAKGVAIHCWVSDDVPAIISVDPIRLEQVLLNLLSNAVKFTDVGRVEIAISIDTVIEQGSGLVCTVKDSGVGMSDQQLARLFTPFEQGDLSTTRRHGGTGLGLAITKRLVLLMGGSITATSELRVGSTFTVRLPLALATAPLVHGQAALAEKEQRDEATRDAPVRPRLRGLHLLVVEDNEVNQLVIHGMLQAEGASVEVVSDGYAAIERVQTSNERQFDAVLLDVMMPGIDGYETSRRLLASNPALAIIGQTAHAMPEDLALCRAAGMVDRIVKPIVIDDLVKTVRRHVSSSADELR